MGKRIALKDSVEVDAVDLSNLARTVEFSSEHERIDVSGFSATGANEFLAGQTTQTVTVEFYGSYGTGEVHQTLYPIHKDREIVVFQWRPDQTAVVGVTNPELRGNDQRRSGCVLGGVHRCRRGRLAVLHYCHPVDGEGNARRAWLPRPDARPRDRRQRIETENPLDVPCCGRHRPCRRHNQVRLG
jgi:hypothetical protein